MTLWGEFLRRLMLGASLSGPTAPAEATVEEAANLPPVEVGPSTAGPALDAAAARNGGDPLQD
jgi:hypothetical protein